jgi:hypothetical protein
MGIDGDGEVWFGRSLDQKKLQEWINDDQLDYE